MKEKLCEICHKQRGEKNSESQQEYGTWICYFCEEEILLEEAGNDFEGYQPRVLEI